MGKFLKEFGNHTDYQSFIDEGGVVKPNVSYCVTEVDVHYNPYDYSDRYFTTIARENGTITFTYASGLTTEQCRYIEYSEDDGSSWTKIENNGSGVTETVEVTEGEKVLWRGDNNVLSFIDMEARTVALSNFASSCKVDLEGNIMSLLYATDFEGEKSLDGKTYAFAMLFNTTTLGGASFLDVVNAKNLCLPATTLAMGCYYGMFAGCTNLTTAPQLLATTLSEACYVGMFQDCTSLTTGPSSIGTSGASMPAQACLIMFDGCTSLTTAPQLPATTLADSCYDSMFIGCTSLTTAPELPATTLASRCYSNMFEECSNLTTPPELPATTLAEECYFYMFGGCNNLTVAPELPATTLAEGCYKEMFHCCISLTTPPELPATIMAKECYRGMFSGCESLLTAPSLPSTTLADSCYYNMFGGAISYHISGDNTVFCTSLTTAPELPATTLANKCYQFMFDGCASLNYIKAMFTTTPGVGYTDSWVQNVASSGTFVKNSAATWNVAGINGIPTGWTVETASE